MKTYISIFRIRFINSLQYRTVTLASIIASFTWGFMEILTYFALYHNRHVAFPMNFAQTVSYIWIQETLLILFRVVFSDGEIYDAIGTGSIAYELVRPADLYSRWFCQSTANRVAFTLINSLPALFIAFVIPKPFRMSLPNNFWQFILFLLSTLLALFVVVAFAMLMYISLFYMKSARGIKIIVTAITWFFSGGVIPLPFFPPAILKVVELLPFAAMQNMPLRIYNGNTSGIAALEGIIFQLFWLIVLVFIGKFTMGRALKKVTVQGG